MRARRMLVTLLLLFALGKGPLLAEEEEPVKKPLTLAKLFGGRGSFTKPIPSWSWRPGHVQLVRLDRRKDPQKPKAKPRPILVTMDPESGQTADLFDLSTLRDLVPGKGRAMRGIGRSGPPTFKWSKDGKALCAVVKGDLVWVDLAKGTTRRLTKTTKPLVDLNVAPDGAHVSFSRGNELWVVSTTGGEPRQLTIGGSDTLLNATLDWVYPEELGFRTAAWWSPDGKTIAYLEMDEAKVPKYRVPGILPLRSQGREMFYPKAGDPNPDVCVVLVSLEDGESTCIDLGDPAPEYVVRVGWSEGGKDAYPYVVTLDRAQQHLRFLRADPATGASRVVFEERDEAWVSRPPAPRFRPSGPAEFLWRRDGATDQWTRASTGKAGEAAAFDPVTPDGLEAGDVLHYDWKTGRGLCAGLVHGEHAPGVFRFGKGVGGIERPAWASRADRTTRASIDETGTYALVTTSGATAPSKVDLVRLKDGAVVREIGDARAPALDKVDVAVPEYGHIEVEGAEGRIRWRLWKPADFDAGRSYGLIVHTYGGPGSRLVSDDWGRGPFFATLLCQRGFLLLQVDGRGTSGQGRDWMKCVHGKLGMLELEDQVRAVQAITERPYVDAGRVGIWGWSYGGTMTCNALTMRSDVFKAGVAVAPVTDWLLYDTIYTERYMGTPKENPAGYKTTASVGSASKMTGNLLIMHGMSDDNVHVQNTMRLIEAFIKAKKTNYDVHLYPKRGHGIAQGATLDVFTRIVRHFETHLK